MQKTFHLLGLAHLPTNKQDALSCAFSQKVLKMGTMLKNLGHKVFFYGNEGSTVECDEFVQVSSKDKLNAIIGPREANQFFSLTSDANYNNLFAEFMKNAVNAINSRKNDKDILLCSYGLGHKAIAYGVNIPITVESGIGYRDTFAPFRIFESYAWMHYLYGVQHQENGINYDCVIPNYFDPADFEYSDKKQNYMLYVGRMIHRKGVEIAMQLAEHTGIVLKMAGQLCGEDINYKDRINVEYVGYADWQKRRELYRDAMVTLVPTQYVGPFEGVSIESLLSGTPVISTDWGVFTETIIHGLVGYRCRTWDDYLWAIKNIGNIKSEDCRQYAIANFSMDRVKGMYEEYFDKLLDLFQPKGWYEIHDDRNQLDWLRKTEVTEVTDNFVDKKHAEVYVTPEVIQEAGQNSLMPIHQICSGNFRYEYYLSIMSALKTHKFSEYNLWIIGPPISSPYLDFLRDKINIRQADLSFLGISSIAESRQLPGFANKDDHFIRVHLKDMVAWDVLCKYGGLFMDLDTFSIQDCSDLYNQCVSSCFFAHRADAIDAWNVGVMIAKPKSQTMAICRLEAMKKLGDVNCSWADTGPILLTNIIRQADKSLIDMLMPVGICDNEMTPNVTEWFRNEGGKIWDQCRVLHTYGSGTYTKPNLNEMFIITSKSPYANLVKQVLSEKEWNPFKIKPNYNNRAMMVFMTEKEGSNPLTGIEIGVLAGQNAVELLTKLNIQKLYLIDPYKQYDSDIYTQSQLDEARRIAHINLEPYKDRIQWIPMGSSEAIAYFIDNDIKVDFVYCDGGHAKDEVLADINNYYPIATKYIGGHDYMTYEGIKEDAIKYPGAARGVNDAVIEYTKNNGLVYYCAQINHADWWIDKTKQGS
jgi:glycosyltransferase involved in cell wall biosynthesis